MPKLNNLTLSEKAALTYAYYNGITHFAEIFDLCHSSKAKDTSKPRIVSEWKNSELVQNYLQQLQAIDEQRIRAKASLMMNDGKEDVKDSLTKNVDFTNVTQFLSFANEKANLINDDRERREYLKIIADLMRFKETGQNKDEQIQRFYTPLTCKECRLYKERKNNTLLK